MKKLHGFLFENGLDVKSYSQKKFLRKFKAHFLLEAIIIYVHGAFHPKVVEILIHYCSNGGILIPIHHAIASAKLSNPKWCEFVGIKMHKNLKKSFAWKVYPDGCFYLVNLQTDSPVTTFKVKYHNVIEFRPKQKILSSHDSFKEHEIPLESPSEGWPALIFPSTELFETQIFLPDPNRTYLFGYKYIFQEPGKKPIVLEGIAGWRTKRENGTIYYFQLGHKISDFSSNYCQVLLNCIRKPTI